MTLNIDLEDSYRIGFIGIDDYKGSLHVGKDADISIFDEEMNCHLAISEGRIIFNHLA